MLKTLKQLLPAFECSFTQADGQTLYTDSDGAGDAASDFADVEINSLVFDSRDVVPGSLFFALPGTHIHGNEFIPAAVEKGANVIVFQDSFSKELQVKIAMAVAKRAIESAVSDGSLKENNAHSSASVESAVPFQIPVFCKVENSRYVMAPISDCFYDSPSKKLAVIGVTGTEGKSSTVAFIWQLLRLCGKKAGFISTVQYSLGGEAVNNPQHQTTPEAPIIQHHLYKMLENGCEYAVVETSSHGLSKKLNRTGNILFDCGVFMNVTLEHLEFHKTFEQYRDDKANLFRALDEHNHVKTLSGKQTEIPSIGIVNLEDPSAEYFINATKKRVYGFTTDGLAGKAAAETGKNAVALPPIPDQIRYLAARNIASARYGLTFDIDADGNDAVLKPTDDLSLPRTHKMFHIQAEVPGAFNAYNIMAAVLAVSSVTKLGFEEICQKVSELTPIKGRMTVVNKNQPFEVIVDYAHTPSSFETIFPPIRKRCSGKMFAVFGSGGERDLKKRPLQGEIAANFCDAIILADEDPRGEDPVELLKMIANGAVKAGKELDKDLFIVPDRKKAIRKVFQMASKGDIVLLLGKSHENSIIYKDHVMPYDEIKEAETALAEMGYN